MVSLGTSQGTSSCWSRFCRSVTRRRRGPDATESARRERCPPALPHPPPADPMPATSMPACTCGQSRVIGTGVAGYLHDILLQGHGRGAAARISAVAIPVSISAAFLAPSLDATFHWPALLAGARRLAKPMALIPRHHLALMSSLATRTSHLPTKCGSFSGCALTLVRVEHPRHRLWS